MEKTVEPRLSRRGENSTVTRCSVSDEYVELDNIIECYYLFIK